MSPYYIGVFAMLLIITLKDFKFEIRGRRAFLGLMTFSCFVLAALVFWPYEDVKDAPEERWSLASNQVYYALSRPAWGAGLAIMSFALVFKSNLLRSLIGTLLSCEIWQPLGKLTYTMYLIHWMVLTIYYADLVGLGMKALMARMSKKGPSGSNKDRKGSGDSELARVASKQSTSGKASSRRGVSARDKLLIEGRQQRGSTSPPDTIGTYGTGNGDYASLAEAEDDRFESMVSRTDDS